MAIRFSRTELAQVPKAIEKAEAGTQAEIFAVLTERSDTYRFVAYSFLALWIFVFSVVLALWWQWTISADPAGGWGTGPTAYGIHISLPVFVFAQIAAFVTGVIILRLFPALAVAITPGRITRERAHANGVKQFLAHGIHNTSGRTGILVFISLDERYGEIFVDTAIEEKIGRGYFMDQVAVLVENCARGDVINAYVEVIESVGKTLSKEFPALDDNRDELANGFVIL